jgi:hypothetical protein
MATPNDPWVSANGSSQNARANNNPLNPQLSTLNDEMSPLSKISLYMLACCALFTALAHRALRKGEVMLPFGGKFHYFQRTEMPLVFWFCFSLYCFFAVGAVALWVLAVFLSKT